MIPRAIARGVGRIPHMEIAERVRSPADRTAGARGRAHRMPVAGTPEHPQELRLAEARHVNVGQLGPGLLGGVAPRFPPKPGIGDVHALRVGVTVIALAERANEVAKVLQVARVVAVRFVSPERALVDPARAGVPVPVGHVHRDLARKPSRLRRIPPRVHGACIGLKPDLRALSVFARGPQRPVYDFPVEPALLRFNPTPWPAAVGQRGPRSVLHIVADLTGRGELRGPVPVAPGEGRADGIALKTLVRRRAPVRVVDVGGRLLRPYALDRLVFSVGVAPVHDRAPLDGLEVRDNLNVLKQIRHLFRPDVPGGKHLGPRLGGAGPRRLLRERRQFPQHLQHGRGSLVPRREGLLPVFARPHVRRQVPHGIGQRLDDLHDPVDHLPLRQPHPGSSAQSSLCHNRPPYFAPIQYKVCSAR